jgi:hypothetical protein
MQRFHVKQLFFNSLLVGVVGLAAWGALPAAHAQKVYRCPSANGSTMFSDTPCTGAGAEVIIKPTAGQAAANDSKAQALARFSPECRQAQVAFEAKSKQPGGLAELRKPGNPLTAAWLACEWEQANRPPTEAEKAQQEAAAKKVAAQLQQQQAVSKLAAECEAKRQAVANHLGRVASHQKVSDQEREVARKLEKELTLQCR